MIVSYIFKEITESMDYLEKKAKPVMDKLIRSLAVEKPSEIVR